MGDYFTTQAVSTFFADNKIIVGSLNVIGLFGALYAFAKAVTAVWRFSRQAYRTTIKQTVAAYRRRRRIDVLLCARDTHYFVVLLAHSALLLALLTLAIIVGLVPPQSGRLGFLPIEAMEFKRAFRRGGTMVFIVIYVRELAVVLNLLTTVRRYRRKTLLRMWAARRQRSRSTRRASVYGPSSLERLPPLR